MTNLRLLLALAPLALLAGCNDEPADDGRSATGEVLEGTISDAMLPVDRVRSQPPLEDPEAFAEAVAEGEEGAAAPRPAGEEAADADADADAVEGVEAEPAAGEPAAGVED